MKYALFVLGVLLIVVGGYCIYAGSNIIEVERGWSSVIAGTTALTGGIITLGLAAVTKRLDDLYRVWAAGVPKSQAIAAAAGPTGAESAPVPAEIPEAVLQQGPMPAGVETAPLPADLTFAASEPMPAAPDVLPGPLNARLMSKYGPPPIPIEPSSGVERRQRVAENLNQDFAGIDPQPPEPPPEPLEAITPPPLEFFDFDSDETAGEDHFEREQTNPAQSAHSSGPAEPRLPETDVTRPTGKAIGRYEAEGTVYVMFADGSIEVQSAQGTRHFKSMADLKTSFQSKD